MKKHLAIMLAIVALLSATVGMVASAATAHTPVVGNKLVATGEIGSAVPPGGQTRNSYTFFYITNTDCVNSITITRVSVLRSDGTVVYQGPFVSVNVTGGRSIVTTVAPHQTISLNLSTYMWIGKGDPNDPTDPANWESDPAILSQPGRYLLEVGWQSAGKPPACAPFGIRTLIIYVFSVDGTFLQREVSELAMENVVQYSK